MQAEGFWYLAYIKGRTAMKSLQMELVALLIKRVVSINEGKGV